MPSAGPGPRVELPDTQVETRFAASHERHKRATDRPPSLPTKLASPEFDLLRFCARVNLTPQRENQIAAVNLAAINWDEFFPMAEHHGVLPLVAQNLLSCACNLPEQVTRLLQAAHQSPAARILWFAGELVRITEHFEKRKIEAVPYKGPILAESVYGDLALRSFNDLDFLLCAADFASAKQALAELGYQPSKHLRPDIQPLWLKFGYECAFDSAAGRYLVELQWKLLPHFYAVDLDIAALLDRAVGGSLAGTPMKILCPEDLLLVLCLHAAKHLWMRLMWITDIAETMRTQTIDYQVLTSRARELGVLRILAVSFWLAMNVLETPLPPSAQNLIDADPEVTALSETFADRLRTSATYDFDSSQYFRLIARLREDRADRWRYLWRLLWTPGEADLLAVRLPRATLPLYRLVRLARLLPKAF